MDDKEIKKLLESDTDGMQTYEYIANNVDSCMDRMPELIDNLNRVDSTGQFLCSTARFLAAIDKEHFKHSIAMLVAAAIDKDRELKYLGSLLSAIWGDDYHERADELRKTDDNFRRVYKRVFDHNII